MRPTKQAIYSSRTADKFVVRLPDGMREIIAEVARQSHRSMNSEIIARLEASILADAKEENPAMTITYESGDVMPEVEPWNPVAGMLVRSRLDASKVYALADFDVDDKGNVLAELATGDGNPDIKMPLGHLQPFIVK